MALSISLIPTFSPDPVESAAGMARTRFLKERAVGHRGLRTSTCIVLARDFVEDVDARVLVADLIFRLTHEEPEISPMALSAKVRAFVAEEGLR